MSHNIAYAPTWDNNPYRDYLALAHHLAPATTLLHDSRPCSASSSSSPPLHDRHARFEAAAWAANDLYQFDLPTSVDSPLTSPEPEQPEDTRVKQEDVQDDFIFEAPAPSDAPALPAFSSMTEVPLRATQATKEMRRMMTVFRLDPFTMHNAVRDPNANVTWNGEPIGPLREKPTLHEFQLEVSDRVKAEPSPLLHHVLLDEPDHSGSRRHRPSPTPSPPLYDSLGSPSLSPLDHHAHDWPESSSDTPSLGYPTDLIQSEPYSTVMTPADGIAASMSINLSSRYSAPSLRMPPHPSSLTTSLSSITRQRSPLSHSSLSYQSSSSPPLHYADVPSHGSSSSPSYMHSSSTMPSSTTYSNSTLGPSYTSGYASSHHAVQPRQGLAPYTITTPVQLPPLPSSRYTMPHDHIGVGTTDGYRASHPEEGVSGQWFKRSISLAMFKVFHGTGSSPGSSAEMPFAPPHLMNPLATRRMTSSSLSGAGIGAQSGIARRTAWT
ncbi:hypothetical protein PHLGIDRAFT_424795 [Phlebiopsis gigantea 11061_1 CR5-6]|uniref:Uncharacterized protein n=1 Tax=Phlebiopsis gigantea (strain 11061_1 CR5-6) TaxID=745531 RepID=A0A0C3S8B6_PHLG1|nr:hypothetical protein PHLGIDRAFT_424795 [Phlebiopsis gigantea 11061_1 CR5-6]